MRSALVVLGYHEYGADGAHRISATCRACVRRAEGLARESDPAVVVFSGWSSTGGASEGEQMRALWTLDGPELVVEPQARMTSENAAYSLLLLLGRGIDRATVVCSIRHRLRVPYLFGRLFRSHGVEVGYEFVTWPLPRPRTWIGEAGGLVLMRRHRRAADALVR